MEMPHVECFLSVGCKRLLKMYLVCLNIETHVFHLLKVMCYVRKGSCLEGHVFEGKLLFCLFVC